MTIGPCPDLPEMLSEGPCSLWLFQVIQATIEKHKQNSQTFKAFRTLKVGKWVDFSGKKLEIVLWHFIVSYNR